MNERLSKVLKSIAIRNIRYYVEHPEERESIEAINKKKLESFDRFETPTAKFIEEAQRIIEERKND